ncbi:hypothetical protein [Streptomyces sp. NPDC003635]
MNDLLDTPLLLIYEGTPWGPRVWTAVTAATRYAPFELRRSAEIGHAVLREEVYVLQNHDARSVAADFIGGGRLSTNSPTRSHKPCTALPVTKVRRFATQQRAQAALLAAPTGRPCNTTQLHALHTIAEGNRPHVPASAAV